MKKFNKVCLFSIGILFFLTDALALVYYDTAGLSRETPPEYLNYAAKGSYLNPGWVGEVPAWNYYDIFGNHLLEGFYLYGMSMDRNSAGTAQSGINLHPILKKWLNGMVQVGDISDKRGILAMIGDRVKTEFTPWTFNQSLFCGARFDIFFDALYGMNTFSLITSTISNTGQFGGVSDAGVPTDSEDWLHGFHYTKKINENFYAGATWINMHHSEMKQGNSFNGNLNDSFPKNTPTAMYIYGLNGHCNLTVPKLTLDGEFDQCQDVLGGSFSPRPGDVATVNLQWDIFDQLKLGGEGYIVQARYHTNFSDPLFPKGDEFGSGKYMYSLVEDNDDRDEYPENGQSKINAVPLGDPDGVIPMKYDKNKNNVYDFEEDFLNYECDPPKSALYFDKNNNGVPDDIEDDAYPDYPYVPSFYLPQERYMRYNDMAGKWVNDSSDGQVSKGLLGFHVKGSYQILPKLNLTLGAVSEESEQNSFQMTYQDTVAVGQIYAPERSTTLYSLLRYKNDLAGDKKLTVDNYLRTVKDNIPNHTQTSYIGFDSAHGLMVSKYNTVVDPLDYRDALVEMLVGQYEIFRNRGFNFTTRGKWEFTKHFPHLDFNYPDENISSLILLNKCEYIYLLPFFKDMFLIPKYKNYWEYSSYGPTSDYGPRSASLDYKYKRNAMSNNGYIVHEWKFSEKTAITTGFQYSIFNDFNNPLENYYHGNFTIQLLMKDRYSGLNVILTTGFSKYNYVFYNSGGTMHNPLNNEHRVTDDINSYELFLKVHCGF